MDLTTAVLIGLALVVLPVTAALGKRISPPASSPPRR